MTFKPSHSLKNGGSDSPTPAACHSRTILDVSFKRGTYLKPFVSYVRRVEADASKASSEPNGAWTSPVSFSPQLPTPGGLSTSFCSSTLFFSASFSCAFVFSEVLGEEFTDLRAANMSLFGRCF